ncbi:MFS transporter [Escherichia coli]
MSLYVIGVSCTYDVFDQQFANFFTSFFATGEQGTRHLVTIKSQWPIT